MGLDVYLYRYENYEQAMAIEEKYNRYATKHLWGRADYNTLTEAEKAKLRIDIAEYAKVIGASADGEPNCSERIELPSKTDPKHYFKIGYFRSSYNSGGFNTVMGDLIGNDLYTIFGEHDEYHVKPDWAAAREIAIEMLNDAIRAAAERPYYVTDVSIRGNLTELSNRAAVDIVLEHLKNKDDEFECYSSGEGFFDLNGSKLIAAIPALYYGSPSVKLVFEDKDHLKWYLDALRIVIETIDYVLQSDDPDKYVLHWSA